MLGSQEKLAKREVVVRTHLYGNTVHEGMLDERVMWDRKEMRDW